MLPFGLPVSSALETTSSPPLLHAAAYVACSRLSSRSAACMAPLQLLLHALVPLLQS